MRFRVFHIFFIEQFIYLYLFRSSLQLETRSKSFDLAETLIFDDADEQNTEEHTNGGADIDPR